MNVLIDAAIAVQRDSQALDEFERLVARVRSTT